MTYNLHPIIVHFPIALLFFYSFIKILPVQRWFQKTSWKSIERFLLLIGTLGIFIAKASGETAEHITQPNHELVHMHEFFANTVTVFYVALVIIEFLPTVNFFLKKKKLIPVTVIQKLDSISLKIKNKWLVIILSILGLLALFITGLLGGVMTHGPTADPIAPFVLNILGL